MQPFPQFSQIRNMAFHTGNPSTFGAVWRHRKLIQLQDLLISRRYNEKKNEKKREKLKAGRFRTRGKDVARASITAVMDTGAATRRAAVSRR